MCQGFGPKNTMKFRKSTVVFRLFVLSKIHLRQVSSTLAGKRDDFSPSESNNRRPVLPGPVRPPPLCALPPRPAPPVIHVRVLDLTSWIRQMIAGHVLYEKLCKKKRRRFTVQQPTKKRDRSRCVINRSKWTSNWVKRCSLPRNRPRR